MRVTIRLMNKEQRDVIVNLHISDQQTKGNPSLSADDVPIARPWLVQILADSEKMGEHVELLAELYRAAFQPRKPRRDRWEDESDVPSESASFTHCELLPEAKAKDVANNGPGVLKDEDVACLLLNPFALHDLADLICTILPDWWMEPLAVAGREIIRRYNLTIPSPPETPDPSEELVRMRGARRLQWRGDSMEIPFDTENLPQKRRIADGLYGDPAREFTLTLHWRKADSEGNYAVELEVKPAPIENNLTLIVDFKGHKCTFPLEVPSTVRLDPEAEPPDRVFAQAAESIVEEALRLEGLAEWKEETWPPYLLLRCRRRSPRFGSDCISGLVEFHRLTK